MAYNRAPRRSLAANSQTGPHVAPNSYQVTYEDSCSCKGTNWAPFLTCAPRSTTAALQDTPGPDAYYPQPDTKIIGGTSLRYTAPRFPGISYGYPAPNQYDPYKTYRECKQDPPARLKGFLYHCHVPYTLLGYMPSIRNAEHIGYKFTEDRVLVECCEPENKDTTIEPAFYHYDTFCSCYKGSYWSKYSRRPRRHDPETPAVGTYNLTPEPSQLQDYLNRVRQERQRNARIPRYIEKVQSDAIRNCYPAPNQYHVDNTNKCPRVKKKIVPKRLPQKTVPVVRYSTPAPNHYTDCRTALEYLIKPSCKKELNAFLSNAPRFGRDKVQVRPAPNEYNIPSFTDARKVSPYAVRHTAFDTSVPKKLYYLPPDYPPIPTRKRCRCSETPSAPEPEPPKPHPTYPFASKTLRFRPPAVGYDANCASYSIHDSFLYLTQQRSFRKVKRYDFLFKQKRFSRLTGFGAVEDKRYIPGLKYNLLKRVCKGTGGKFSKAERFPKDEEETPGPLQYGVVGEGIGVRTFNVTLKRPQELSTSEKYRTRLLGTPRARSRRRRRHKGKKSWEVCVADVPVVSVELPLEQEKQWKKKTRSKRKIRFAKGLAEIKE